MTYWWEFLLRKSQQWDEKRTHQGFFIWKRESRRCTWEWWWEEEIWKGKQCLLPNNTKSIWSVPKDLQPLACYQYVVVKWPTLQYFWRVINEAGPIYISSVQLHTIHSGEWMVCPALFSMWSYSSDLSSITCKWLCLHIYGSMLIWT